MIEQTANGFSLNDTCNGWYYTKTLHTAGHTLVGTNPSSNNVLEISVNIPNISYLAGGTSGSSTTASIYKQDDLITLGDLVFNFNISSGWAEYPLTDSMGGKVIYEPSYGGTEYFIVNKTFTTSLINDIGMSVYIPKSTTCKIKKNNTSYSVTNTTHATISYNSYTNIITIENCNSEINGTYNLATSGDKFYVNGNYLYFHKHMRDWDWSGGDSGHSVQWYYWTNPLL